MGWWKADPIPDPRPQPPSTPPHPIPTQSPSASTSESSCPVDPKTRAIWLQQAQKTPQAQSQLPPSHPPLPKPTATPTPPKAAVPTAYASSQECSSDRIDQSPLRPSDTTSLPASSRPLSQDRVVSSIPRAMTPESTPSAPANNESETGTSTSGNWIYPSESQFFNAVMRKQTSSNPSDLISSISHIIPIHNAVNERAWSLIKKWEGDTSASCGGPKLQSFKGLGSGAISPKARVKTFMGYTEPFDRHDWVVERCGGETVEYVIDFYQGKQEASGNPNALNFYLDVRPKLNTFEGWKMRAERFAGWR